MIPALLGMVPLILMGLLWMVGMTAQSVDRDPKHQAGGRVEFGVAASATIYVGSALVFDGGYVKPFTTALALKVFAGVAVESAANGSGSADDLQCQVYRNGVHEFVGSGLADTDIGREVWLTDDQTVTTTPQCALPCGIIVNVPAATKPLVDITGYTTRPAGVHHLEYAFGNLNTVSTTTCTVPIGAIHFSTDLEVLVHMAGASVDAGDADDVDGYIDGTGAAAVGWTVLAGSDADTIGVLMAGADQTGSTIRLHKGFAAATALKVTTTNHADLSCVLHYLIYLPGGNA